MSFISSFFSGAGGGSAGASSAVNGASSFMEQGMKTTGNILGGVSSFLQSKNAEKYYKANGKNAMQEAKNAAFVEKEKYKQLASAQSAAYGASGVDVNAGSPLDVMAATDAEGAVSAMQMLYSGEVEAANWKLREKSAKNAGISSLLGMGMNLLDPMGKGGLSSLWGNFQKSGGGGSMLGG